ncbi:MAG: flagellar hook-associated protein FlgL [Methylovulum sp.]|nr:flagellar hook-associated protein FlgL [Methylovulum sp.]
MRISTAWSQQVEVNALQSQQSKLVQTQIQLGSNQKINNASDDPLATLTINNLNKSIAQTTQYQTNITTAEQRLELEDSVLQSATDILGRIKELAVQSLNATYSANDRSVMAMEMEGLNDELMSIANTKNTNGEYIFAGFKSSTPAFTKATASSNASATDATSVSMLTYTGDLNTRSIQIGLNRQIKDGDNGVTVFGEPNTTDSLANIPAGSFTNVFQGIEKMVTDLRANQPNDLSLTDLDNSLNKLVFARASVGVRLNALEDQNTINDDFLLGMKSVLSDTQDLDYTEAISRLNAQSLSLQIAQQSYAQIKQLSLFKYL